MLKLDAMLVMYDIPAYSFMFQGQVSEAESLFVSMRSGGCFPDIVAYTAMLHCYNACGKIK